MASCTIFSSCSEVQVQSTQKVPGREAAYGPKWLRAKILVFAQPKTTMSLKVVDSLGCSCQGPASEKK